MVFSVSLIKTNSFDVIPTSLFLCDVIRIFLASFCLELLLPVSPKVSFSLSFSHNFLSKTGSKTGTEPR